MNMTELPKFFGGVKLTSKEVELVRQYIEHFHYDRQKLIDAYNSGDDTKAHKEKRKYPYMTKDWGRDGKYVCLACGYVTTVTNICRNRGSELNPNINRALNMIRVEDIPQLLTIESRDEK